jgi:hypothetical protein
MSSLVQQLRSQALDLDISVSALLRTGTVVASRLSVVEMSDWLEWELNGYRPANPTPDYRNVNGRLVYWNPYHGWQPIVSESGGFSRRFVFQPVAELEDLLSKGDATMMMTVPGDFHHKLLEAIGAPPSDVMFQVSRSQFAAILEAVRNRVLKWALEFEERDVVGNGPSFSSKEKARAQEVGNVIHIAHVEHFAGVIGTQTGTTNISARQTSTHGLAGLEAMQIIASLRDIVPRLPTEMQTAVSDNLDIIEGEYQGAKPDTNLVKSAATMMAHTLKKLGGWAMEAAVEGGIQKLMSG